MDLQTVYRAERAPLHTFNVDTGAPVVVRERASQALRNARVKVRWEAAGGYVGEFDPRGWSRPPEDTAEPGFVRLVIRPDDSPFEPWDAPARYLEEQRQRADRDGMWGVEAEFWDGSEWETVDSVWGFIGEDWRGSGYDIDLMSAALDALAEHYAKQAAELEEQRPDLYRH